MTFTFLDLFDLIGTIAFAISGAAVAVNKKMDIFGVNMLAVTTACGGGILRDLLIGNIPPNMFKNPFYFIIACICANVFFTMAYHHTRVSQRTEHFYERLLFWSDTFGLAAFAVDGVIIGVNAGYHDNPFLLVFLGFMTGVGGGALRDIMAGQMPDIFVKHIYALAAIGGALLMVITFEICSDRSIAMILGFGLVIILRFLAEHFCWNLPKVN